MSKNGVCRTRILSICNGAYTVNDLSSENILNKFTPQGTCYTVHGCAEQTIVFIHGVGMNQHIWQSQIDYFSKNYTVVVYDMLGHGHSPVPPEDAQLVDYADQLVELVEHLGISKLVLVGHSTGALISVEFALQNSDKVLALLPINIVYNRDAQQSQNVLARANLVLEKERISGIDVTLDRWFSKKKDPTSLKKIAVIREYLSQVNPVGYGRTYKMFAQSDKVFIGRLGKLQVPVLYLTGGDDPNSTSWMSEQMAQESPQGEVNSIADEAHMMAYISPETVNPIIEEFLVRNSHKEKL